MIKVNRAYIRFVTCAVLVAAAGAVHAQPKVTASVDRNQVVVNEPFQVNVTAQGERIADPVIPTADGIRFERTPSANSTSTQFSLRNVNGKSTMIRMSQQEWVYTARPTRAGKLTIPPITVRIDNQDYMSEAIPITAVSGTAAAAQPLQSNPSNAAPAPSQNQNKSAVPTVEDAILLETSVDKKRVYQGELLTLSLQVLQIDLPGINFQGANNGIPLPTREGFYSGPLNKMERKENRNGWSYSVAEHRMPLCPTGAGTFEIGPCSWEGYVIWSSRMGIQQKYRSVATPPIEIEVVPLPERPANFSGAVGRFAIKASLMNSEVVQGVPTQLQVRILGEGNPDAISAPALPAIPWAHLSDPQTETTDNSDWFKMEKKFNYGITPLETGNQTIPAITFCYFAPVSGQYVTETVDPFSVFVKPSGESQQLVTVGGTQTQPEEKVEIIGEDVMPIIGEAGRLKPSTSNSYLISILIILPPIFFGIFSLFVQRQKRLENDSGYARRYYALSKGQKRLKEIEGSPVPGETLFHALTGYLSDCFNVNESGMTSSDARRLLESHALDTDLIENTVKILRTCERTLYAGGKLQPDELQALLRGAESVMERLESAVGKGGRG